MITARSFKFQVPEERGALGPYRIIFDKYCNKFI